MAEVARIHPEEPSAQGGASQEVLGRVEKELAEIRERLTRLEQANIDSDQHRDLLTRAIADIRQRKAALEAKIQEAKTTTKNVSNDLKSGLELAWEDLKTSVDSATSRFFH